MDNIAGPKRILIVEDEQPLVRALHLKLESAGFQSDISLDGIDALQKVRTNHYDLILLDLIMPRMDGFTFLEKLKILQKNIPVIIMSNLGQPEDIKKATELGVKNYLIKADNSLAEIVAKVAQQLSGGTKVET